MTAQSDLDRAMTLAEMAPHSSVTVGVLAGREGLFSDGRLADRAPITYLEPSEAPAYVLTNEKRGIGLGTKRNRLTPDDDRGTVILVTGRRTLCLVGKESGDRLFEIPHRTLSMASYRTGLLAHRVVLGSPRRRYHCWVGRATEEAVLDQATAYIEERTLETPEAVETDDSSAGTISYRGKPISVEQSTQTEPAASPERESTRTVTYRGKEFDPSEIQ